MKGKCGVARGVYDELLMGCCATVLGIEFDFILTRFIKTIPFQNTNNIGFMVKMPNVNIRNV
jgi:hypothetical protein